MSLHRRDFLQSSLVIALAGSLRAEEKKPSRILLRSSWQTVNIGDIGHTPGMLALLEKHMPETEVRLWPTSVGNGVEEMLKARFPKVPLVKTPQTLKIAFDECDFLLHGSGPSLVAHFDVARWRKETGKPYGICGITSSAPQTELNLFRDARFVYFRDSVSLKTAKDKGAECPILEFGPDSAFGVDLRNDKAAVAFLKDHELEEGKFLCVIPRFRHTPYWTIPKHSAVFDKAKHERNEAMKEHDHAPLREAIVAVTRGTPLKVLICPEDETQVALGKALLYDPLPDAVKAKVVWRDKYWLTDEAVSTYVRSAGLFGNEMHSPIMCIGNGVPAIVCRFAEQTSKGLMWRDIGLGDWLFNLDVEKEVSQVAPAVLAMAKDPTAAKAKAAKAQEFVRERQAVEMAALKKALAEKPN